MAHGIALEIVPGGADILTRSGGCDSRRNAIAADDVQISAGGSPGRVGGHAHWPSFPGVQFTLRQGREKIGVELILPFEKPKRAFPGVSDVWNQPHNRLFTPRDHDVFAAFRLFNQPSEVGFSLADRGDRHRENRKIRRRGL